MNFFVKLLRFGLIGLAGGFVMLLLAVTIAYITLSPKLPSINTLKDVRLQVPLRIFTQDNKLIAEFGEKKRTPLRFYQVPENMIKAVLAAEDDRFFQHPGVDYQGILRAGLNLLKTGEKTQGGSTITMQVARNFFLSREKTYLRKINEILLALKIDRELSKEEILELYLNKIFLGHRAYGIAAASKIYYGKTVDQLSLAQMAMIAGLPKAPSRYNPIADPERALTRRNYILGRMLKLAYIDNDLYQMAFSEQDEAEPHGLSIEVEAPYVAEMIRADMVEQYGNEAYTGGFTVVTTIDSSLQQYANYALRKALIDYDTRHGYRGPVDHIDLSIFPEQQIRQKLLSSQPSIGDLSLALVIYLEDQTASLILADDQIIQINWDGLSWARRYIDDTRRDSPPISAADILSEGDVVYVQALAKQTWRLGQIPTVEGALVSLKPDDGRIIALTGGFDFNRSNFNRVTQALRQPGSNFKPFIYSAALAKGFTTASIFNDAPVVFEDPGLESTWRPENYSGKFFGPTRLRQALIKSRNLVSIRLLRATGIRFTIDYISRFGFDPATLPRNLSLALGSGSLPPLQIAGGYAVIANGGYSVTPYYIQQTTGNNDEIIYQAEPATVCPECEKLAEAAIETGTENILTLSTESNKLVSAGQELKPLPQDTLSQQIPTNIAERVITAENAYLMTTMMRDVIRQGTGRRARALGRRDLAGKTGTSNDQRDAWFSGFNSEFVTVTWVGFDKTRSLGNNETGGRAALPMWIEFMGKALKGLPQKPLIQPDGLVTVRIDPETGLLAESGNPDAIFETFRTQYVPKRVTESTPNTNGHDDTNDPGGNEPLF